MKFGISIPQVFPTGDVDPSLISDFMVKAESLGYDSAWVQERMYGGLPSLHPIALLSYAAAVTSRIKLGTAVMLPTLRGPVPLAKSLASLDQLSKGRVIAGVGLGGNPRAYPAFGITSEGRASRFAECIRVIKMLWTQEEVTFHGRFWQLDGISTTPRPVQKPHPPIWFGAHSVIGLKRAIRLGDGWMGAGNSTPQEFKKEVSQVRMYLEEARRDPATFSLSKRVYVQLDKDKNRASQKIHELFAQHYWNGPRGLEVSLFGSDQECFEGLSEIASSDVDLLILNPVYDDIEQAERLARDVIPKLKT